MFGYYLNGSHDMELNADGSLRMASDGDKAKQDLLTRLRTFSGEVVLDSTYGFKYDLIIGGKSVSLAEAESEIRQYILETDGIVELKKFNLDFVGDTVRKLIVNFSVTSEYSASEIFLTTQLGA